MSGHSLTDVKKMLTVGLHW